MSDLTIAKLGGSVITHKGSSPPQVNSDNLTRIANELKSFKNELVLVLGGGAHGHQAAHAFGFGDPSTKPTRLIEGIPSIRHNMSLLSLNVEESLNHAGIPAVVIPPFPSVVLNENQIMTYPVDAIKLALQSGFTVITHGDVCFDQSNGAGILSGDTIAVYLALQLKAKYLYIGTDVDGIYNDNPKINPDASLYPEIDAQNMKEVLDKTGPSSSTDVTGGMAKKLNEILLLKNQDVEIVIFNLTISNRFSELLNGTPTTCTRINI